MKKENVLLGFHASVAGGVHKAFEHAESLDCTAMQIFTKSNHKLFDKAFDPAEIERFKNAAEKSSVKSLVTHAGYLINLGSPKPESVKAAKNSLIDELNRCDMLGIPTLVLHPGAHVGQGEEKALAQIAKCIDDVLERQKGTASIALENMAGQGTVLGKNFEELKEIYSKIHHKSRVGFCLDTCHAHVSEYELATATHYHEMIKKFDTILGLKNLLAIHLNDSVMAAGSHKDRHANIEKGTVGKEVFKALINDPLIAHVPKILETPYTPKDLHEVAEDLTIMRSLLA